MVVDCERAVERPLVWPPSLSVNQEDFCVNLEGLDSTITSSFNCLPKNFQIPIAP